MAKFWKKPVCVEAFEWHRLDGEQGPEWLRAAIDAGEVSFDDGTCQIKTLEGTMTAQVGDWIILGVQGEMYPCKPDIFELTYESDAERRRRLIDTQGPNAARGL